MTKRKLKGDRNQCPTCGEYFNSVTAFSMHRAGDFGDYDKLTKLTTPSNRRCLSIKEMLDKKMVKNESDYWCKALFTAKAINFYESKKNSQNLALK